MAATRPPRFVAAGPELLSWRSTARLSDANPNLPKDTLEELLLVHSGHHLQQIQEVQAGQFEKEAATWGAMKGHIYVIADALTDALAKQFPEKL